MDWRDERWELGLAGAVRSRQGTEPITAPATCMPAALGKQRHTLCLSFLTGTAELMHTSVPLGMGLLCSQGCCCCWPPASSCCLQRCLALAAAEPGYKARDCVAQGLFLPSSPLPRLPHCSFPELWPGAGQALLHPGTRSPWEWSCSLPQSGHLRAISRWPKIKPEEASLAQHPAGCTGLSLWVLARLGAALARMDEAPPDLLCPRQTRGRGPSTPL